MPRNLRFRTFKRVLTPFSQSARQQRMLAFLERLEVEPRARVIDLGGNPDIWDSVDRPLHITVLNLPGFAVRASQRGAPQHDFEFVEGDACSVDQFGDGQFDIVFSNSVIEHVGDDSRQSAFAREVERLADRYWVQTPAIWFPIEAHTGMPLWFFYPEGLRQTLLRRWSKKLPRWANAVRETRVLSHSRLRGLFPGSDTYVERLLGIPKSYVAYRAR